MITVLFLLSAFYRLVVLLLSTCGIRNYRQHQLTKHDKHKLLQNTYVFIFPVYQEQSIILDTCRYVKTLVEQYDILVYFVGDYREIANPTTIGMVEEYFGDHARIKTLVDNAPGTKAHKVNYCLDVLSKETITFDYVVVCDCDARINLDNFIQTDSELTETFVDICSYVPFPRFSVSQSFVAFAATLQSLERALAFELGGNMLPQYMVYPMGATMMLSQKAIAKLGKIPEPIDDVPLGYIATQYKLKKKNLANLVSVLPVQTRISFLKQHIPIFHGVFSIFSQLKYFIGYVSWQDYCRVWAYYTFLLLEFLSFLTLHFLLIVHMNMFLLLLSLYVVTIIITLQTFQLLTLCHFFTMFVGYYFRCIAFFNFVGKSFRSFSGLHNYKTTRSV